jgi:hypothetical protein
VLPKRREAGRTGSDKQPDQQRTDGAIDSPQWNPGTAGLGHSRGLAPPTN